MTLEILSNIQVLHFTEALSRTELLEKMGAIAIEKQWAKPGFVEAMLERESKYATGLHTKGIEVAIPHADPEWTDLPGMVVAFLDQPVDFEPMGGQGELVSAKFVFMLVIPDADTHITFLQGLASFIEDEQKLTLFDQTKDINYLVSFMSTAMNA